MFTALSALCMLGLAAAQAASSADVASVQAEFNGAQLVPDILQTFNPEGVLDVVFGGSSITPGQNFSAADVQTYPTLTVRPGPDAGNITTSGRYTVMMIDADVPGTDALSTGSTRHWLVNGASLSGTDTYAVGYDGSVSVTDYAGPAPPEGSGPHRYVLMVFLQPSDFTPPANLSSPGVAVSKMSFPGYLQESGLEGGLVAANYIQVQNGVATVTYASTSAVNTAALGGATTTSGAVSGSSTMGAAQTGSASSAAGSAKAAATSAAASASATGGAAAGREMGWSVVVGAVGVAGAVIGAGIGL